MTATIRPRIGIDLDSTLLETFGTWADYFNGHRLEHNHAHVCATPDTWGYYRDLCRQCIRECINRSDVLARTPLMEGAEEALWRLYRDYDLYLVTNRPPVLKFNVIRLLSRYGLFRYWRDFFVGWHMPADICYDLGLDVLIDDAPRTLEALRGTATQPVVFDQPYNRYLTDMERVHGWGEVPARLGKMFAEKAKTA